ncbi:hypothetical protein BJX66DRAFT_315858 [Aspergillus keveii]|uniref:Uncharacterized protein n=1 Tax=Aspergillus keveii TaxID=714993 RepID=A0ABR4FNW1_9EURO
MTDYGPPYGYAVRRNETCNTARNEVDCANPWADWHNCCPEDTICGDGGLCCPTEAGCAAPVERDPHCANNGTWDLYWLDGYFCCDSETNGFSFSGLVYNGSQTTGVGCTEGYPSGDYTEVLVPVSYGNETDTDSSSSSTTPSPTTSTSSQTDSPAATATDLPSEGSSSSSSSTNTGAIAGGVVGGVAGAALILALVWFLMRRRRKAAAAASGAEGVNAPVGNAGYGAEPLPVKEQYAPTHPVEMENNAVRAELYGDQHADGGIPHELPASVPGR